MTVYKWNVEPREFLLNIVISEESSPILHIITCIAYTFSVACQFMHDPRVRHMQATDHILLYLNSSLGKGLFFKKEDI